MKTPGLTHLSLINFSGEAPLFPLPNVVLFPDATLPLHIFEPRYRKMTADALDGEQLIAMSLINTSLSGSQERPVPTIHPVVGLGQIVTHELLADGRYMLILRGVARARVVLERDVDLPYRVGKLELCPDIVPSHAEFDRRDRAEQIISLFCRLFSGTEVQKAVHQTLSAELPLGTLCDVIASTLPINPSLAQLFLQEQDCDVRSQMLWQLLNRMEENKMSPAKSFPPVFSKN